MSSVKKELISLETVEKEVRGRMNRLNQERSDSFNFHKILKVFESSSVNL